MRLDECTFWMRGPPETDDFCPGQEGRQGERADESLTGAPGSRTSPRVLSPTGDADPTLPALLHAPWPVTTRRGPGQTKPPPSPCPGCPSSLAAQHPAFQGRNGGAPRRHLGGTQRRAGVARHGGGVRSSPREPSFAPIFIRGPPKHPGLSPVSAGGGWASHQALV